MRALRGAAAWQHPPAIRIPSEIDKVADVALTMQGLGKVYLQSTGIFGSAGRRIAALSDVALIAERGKTLAIVGESGCGKSTLARILSGLQIATAGIVDLDGTQIGGLGIDQRPAGLKRKLQMVFQNPDSTLNPSQSVGYAMGRALRRLKGLGAAACASRGRAPSRRGEAARRVRPAQAAPALGRAEAACRHRPGPRRRSGDHPRRRAGLGARCLGPGGDHQSAVGIAARSWGTTLVFISHDLAVVRYLADSVAVMYLGRVVEFGRAAEIFAIALASLYRGALSAVPDPTPEVRSPGASCSKAPCRGGADTPGLSLATPATQDRRDLR